MVELSKYPPLRQHCCNFHGGYEEANRCLWLVDFWVEDFHGDGEYLGEKCGYLGWFAGLRSLF